MKLMTLIILMVLFINPQEARAGEDAFLVRIQNARALVADHDRRSVADISRQLHATSSAEGNLQIYEAVAATYRDLVASGKITGEIGKKNLYDQIRMNVAFIQFGGDPNYRGGAKINRWIRQTLLNYLPKSLMKDEDMFYSADEWSNKD